MLPFRHHPSVRGNAKMRKPAREALGPFVRPFGLAALGVTFPLVTAANADRPWVPGMETLAPAIVLTVSLWAMSAWLHQVYVAHREGAYLDVVLRAMRAFAAGAVVFVIVTGLTKKGALSPLLIGLYLAFALVLLFGARLGRRAVVTGAHRGAHARRYDGAPTGAEALGPLSPREHPAQRDTPADRAREAEAPAHRGARPKLPEAPAAARPQGGEGVLEPGRVLDAIRSCMDEVSYTPGDPNVLSMTKYVHDGLAREAAARARPLDGERGTGFARVDEGEETVLRINGILDAVSARDVRPTVEALIAENVRSIRVDLSALRLIDSTGVGLIVGLFKRSRTFGGSVRVSGLKDQPLAIFRLLRLDRIFDLQ